MVHQAEKKGSNLRSERKLTVRRKKGLIKGYFLASTDPSRVAHTYMCYLFYVHALSAFLCISHHLQLLIHSR